MNGIKLFRVFGITVFLHWSWFLVAVYEIQLHRDYSSMVWNAIEYLMLFAIVLMHEFGHALACRSVGGQAERIMLWPLGGVAFVNPPPRPGAMLWSIAAGPLVNVALLFASVPLLYVHLTGDVGQLLINIGKINFGLLVFNLLPIYPLDGGQILQSLLWFVLGRGRSLAVATVIGMIGSGAVALFALYLLYAGQTSSGAWLGIMALFAAGQCWRGWQLGAQIRAWKNPRDRVGFACPACGRPPVVGNFWRCANCQTAFDTFETDATCPTCGNTFGVTECGGCRTRSPIAAWRRSDAAPIAPPVPVTPLVPPTQAVSSRTGWM
jgi:Zn-dependent protease/predicted RNA-binding Zn-ribbon protein involved in translation (DUF1610 family)